MKKLISAVIFALSGISAPIFAQSDIKQMSFPKHIYIGDTAEIHYTFGSGVDFFPDEESIDEKNLLFSTLPFKSDNNDFTLQKAVIQKNGPLYTVVLIFTPWKTGYIDFPEFDLYAAVFGISTIPFIIDPKPVEISSIMVDQDTSLRPFASPLLFPGTIYFVYIIIAVILGILIFVVQAVIRWQTISDKIKQKKILRRNAKNFRTALRQLKKLEKKSAKINDVIFCTAIQHIFRNYLTVRMGLDFHALTTNQFIPAFNSATCGVVNGFIVDNMEAIVEIFRRMDYVRFAKNSIDSNKLPKEKYAAALHPGEREEILETSRAIIKLFDRGK